MLHLIYLVGFKNKLVVQNEKEKIWKYTKQNNVINICAIYQTDFWTASLFYAFDEENNCVYVMSSENTRHGQLMVHNPRICGTISNQISVVYKIVGLQFTAEAYILCDKEKSMALSTYLKRFPIAHLKKDTIWKIVFTELKLTDNRLGFGRKLHWILTT